MPCPKGLVPHTPLMLAVNRDHKWTDSFSHPSNGLHQKASSRKERACFCFVTALTKVSLLLSFPLPCLLCPPPLLYMRAEFKTEFHLRGCYFFPFPDLKKEKEAPLEKLVTAIHPYEPLQGFCWCLFFWWGHFSQLWLRTVMLRDPRSWLGRKWPYVFCFWVILPTYPILLMLAS